MAKAIRRSENDVLTEVERRLETASLISADTETSGLDWRVCHSVGYVFTFDKTPKGTYYLPFRHQGGGNYDQAKVVKIAKTAAKRQALHWVFHHADFDLKFLAKDGINIAGSVEDTMVNEALLDEYARSFSLDACCARRGIEGKHKTIYDKIIKQFSLSPGLGSKSMSHFHMMPGDDPDVIDYAAGDGTSTLLLRDYQHDEMAEQSLMTVHGVESKLIKVLHRMTWRGIKVDEERLRQVARIVDQGIIEAKRMLPAGLNTKSNVQLAEWFEAKGIKDYPTTAKGNPSFKEDWLKTNEPGQKIVRSRKYEHMKNSFITPMIERHLYKGRVHATYNQTTRDDFGTVVGRLSCNDPNLQQAHKRNAYYGVLYRSLFVPDLGEFSANDLVQCEPVLLAHYSECRVLLDGYLAEPPIDAHQAVATAAGIQRQQGKTLNQSLITGAGVNRIKEQFGAQLGQQLWDAYFGAMPEIMEFRQQSSRVFRNRGYITTLLGRRLRCPSSDKAYLSVNRVLAGSNADIIKESMVRIDEYLEAEGLRDVVEVGNNVHDDLLFDNTGTRDPRVAGALAECRRIFTDYGPGRFRELMAPMRVDHDEGKNWAEATWGRDEVAKQFKLHGARY